MRQFGVDLARARPSWRRWRFRRARNFDLCKLLAQFYPQFIFPEFGCDEFPEFERLGREVRILAPFPAGPVPRFRDIAALIGGPGCPGILATQGFIGQDPLGVFSLAQAGIPIPDGTRPDRFGWSGGFIHQLRFTLPERISVRRCNLGLTDEEGREVVAAFDALSRVELSSFGFL